LRAEDAARTSDATGHLERNPLGVFSA